MEKLGEKRVETTKEMPMKYYDFFHKVYLIIVIVFNIVIVGLNFTRLQNSENLNVFLLLSIAISICFYIILPGKLKEELELKSSLGFKLVMTFLIFGYAYSTLIDLPILIYFNVYDFSFFSILVGCFTWMVWFCIYSIWYIPNLVYFAKRKHLFVDRKVASKTKKKAVEIKKDIVESNEVLQDTSDRITEIKSEDIKHATTKKANKRGLFANKWRILGMVSIVVNVCLIGSLVFVYIDDRQDIDDLNDTVKSLKNNKSYAEIRYSELLNENANMRSKVNFFDEHVVIVPNNTRVYHRYDCIYCDKSSFLIFNDENAKAMGYRACSHCMK